MSNWWNVKVCPVRVIIIVQRFAVTLLNKSHLTTNFFLNDWPRYLISSRKLWGSQDIMGIEKMYQCLLKAGIHRGIKMQCEGSPFRQVNKINLNWSSWSVFPFPFRELCYPKPYRGQMQANQTSSNKHLVRHRCVGLYNSMTLHEYVSVFILQWSKSCGNTAANACSFPCVLWVKE